MVLVVEHMSAETITLFKYNSFWNGNDNQIIKKNIAVLIEMTSIHFMALNVFDHLSSELSYGKYQESII